jgi:hypothetical protein
MTLTMSRGSKKQRTAQPKSAVSSSARSPAQTSTWRASAASLMLGSMLGSADVERSGGA